MLFSIFPVIFLQLLAITAAAPVDELAPTPTSSDVYFGPIRTEELPATAITQTPDPQNNGNNLERRALTPTPIYSFVTPSNLYTNIRCPHPTIPPTVSKNNVSSHSRFSSCSRLLMSCWMVAVGC